MVSTPDWVLRELRATRAAPPGKAAHDDERRAIYNAALQQFEELLDAARAVGPASRPIPLYYALNQASRAIVAASGDVASIDGHGLANTGTALRESLRRPSFFSAASSARRRKVATPSVRSRGPQGPAT